MKNIKNLNVYKLIAVLFISTITLTSCSDDHDHDHDHEEELITTVNYRLTNGTNVITLTYQDLDGEGGQDGTATVSGPLMANTSYTGVIELLNETESPAENVTVEVKTEGNEHEFFYATTAPGINIVKTDNDAAGNPLGIETTLTTASAGSGVINIVLKHEPTKPNNGSADNAGGSTDLDVTFTVSVQ